MRKVLLFLFFVFGFIVGSYADEIDEKLFQGYDTAFVLFNRTNGEIINADPLRSALRFTPCSTFKIYNTLIGLELGLLKGPDEPWYQWDGVKRGIEGWNQDLTLREAFRVSAVPAFQILAQQIGPERMAEYLKKIGYGTQDISAGIDRFWLPVPGAVSIQISADEQAALLNKLLDGKLPFSAANAAVLHDIMQVETTDRGTLFGKTGSGTDADGNPDIGWYIGFVESKGTTYVFACNITGGTSPNGKTARDIVKNILKSLELL